MNHETNMALIRLGKAITRMQATELTPEQFEIMVELDERYAETVSRLTHESD